jgi:hypothetical protein
LAFAKELLSLTLTVQNGEQSEVNPLRAEPIAILKTAASIPVTFSATTGGLCYWIAVGF